MSTSSSRPTRALRRRRRLARRLTDLAHECRAVTDAVESEGDPGDILARTAAVRLALDGIERDLIDIELQKHPALVTQLRRLFGLRPRQRGGRR